MTRPDLLIALSTAHLRPETLENIEDYICAYPNEYGAFVYVPEITGYDDSQEDLRAAVIWARVRNITWLKFDRDADEIPELPRYEHA